MSDVFHSAVRLFHSRAVGLCITALILATLVANTPAQNSASGPTIVSVEFLGLSTRTPEEATRLIQSRTGTALDQAKVTADLKRLAKAGMVGQAKVRQGEGGMILTFIVEENATLEAVRFVGNTNIETRELDKVVRTRPDDLVTQETVQKARERVLEEYRRRGYMRVQVRADLAEGDAGKKVLQIYVNEGQKIRVEDVTIRGNEFFGSLRLRVELETKGSWMFFDSYYDESAFERDLDAIRALYLGAGFFDVRVSRGEFSYSKAEKTVSPSIVIDEGPRYTFGKIGVEGNTIFTTEEIRNCFRSLEGKPFDGEEYADALDKAKDLYANAGFVTTQIGDRIEKSGDGIVHFVLIVDERARARVGRILVQRREQIHDADPSWFGRIYSSVAPPVDSDVVLREVTLEPGDVYDKRKEQESVERLRRLRVFREVDIESRSTGDPAVRDVLVKVEEGVTGNIFLGLGYSESFGAYLWGNYTERNFLGKAGDLRVNVLAGTREINGTVSYLDRYLGNSDMSLYTEFHAISARRPGYQERNTGLQAELGVPINDVWKTYVRGRLEFVTLDDEDYDPDENFDGSYPVATVRWRFTHDTMRSEKVNGMLMRAAGHQAGFGVEGGFADGPLVKLTANYEMAHRIGEKLVYMGDFRAGLMPFDALDVGPTERFYMGGTNDLRGFAFRGAGPHDSGDSDVPLGGATKLLARNEMHYPFFKQLAGVAFVDVGMLSRRPLSLESPRASAGLGLRLSLNNVQAGVDFAAPLNAQGDDQTRYFHFNLSSLAGF